MKCKPKNKLKYCYKIKSTVQMQSCWWLLQVKFHIASFQILKFYYLKKKNAENINPWHMSHFISLNYVPVST
jgi:hypothetical protein